MTILALCPAACFVSAGIATRQVRGVLDVSCRANLNTPPDTVRADTVVFHRVPARHSSVMGFLAAAGATLPPTRTIERTRPRTFLCWSVMRGATATDIVLEVLPVATARYIVVTAGSAVVVNAPPAAVVSAASFVHVVVPAGRASIVTGAPTIAAPLVVS